MKKFKRQITLRHLRIDDKAQIGFQYVYDKVTASLMNTLPQINWSEEFGMHFILNTKENLTQVINTFKGEVWVNCQYFFENKRVNVHNEILDINCFRKRKLPDGYLACPEEYLQKLELKRYSLNTAKTYISAFELFMKFHNTKDLMRLNEFDIRRYLQYLIQNNKSNSYINQSINAIKFYYEIVNGMPNRFYAIERPNKEEKLPRVISKEDVARMLNLTANIKHRCIIGVLYSAGLRLGELLNLKLQDVDSKRMLIRVEQGKGRKDRYTILSEKMLKELTLRLTENKTSP